MPQVKQVNKWRGFQMPATPAAPEQKPSCTGRVTQINSGDTVTITRDDSGKSQKCTLASCRANKYGWGLWNGPGAGGGVCRMWCVVLGEGVPQPQPQPPPPPPGTSRHIQHSPGTPTTGLRERGNDTGRSTGRSGRQNAATRRNMRREERVTDQGPVKEPQPDGMSHEGGGGGGAPTGASGGLSGASQWRRGGAGGYAARRCRAILGVGAHSLGSRGLLPRGDMHRVAQGGGGGGCDGGRGSVV